MSLSTFSGHVRNLVSIIERRPTVAGAARRGRRRDRPGGGRGARAGPARPSHAAGEADRSDEPLPRAEGVGERDCGRRQRRHRIRSRDGGAALPHRARPAGRVARAPDRRAAGAAVDARRRSSRPRGARAPADRGAAGRGRGAEERAAAERERLPWRARRRTSRGRPRRPALPSSKRRSGGCAPRHRPNANALSQRAEQELAGTKAELDALRAEIRAARRLERERRRATTPKALAKERERDRRLGAASERAARVGRALQAADEPVEITAPLAPGDPVIAPALGVRGTIAEIAREDAVVLGPGGLRVRVPVARLRPDPDGRARAVDEGVRCVRHARDMHRRSSTCGDERRRTPGRRCAPLSTPRRLPGATSCA